MNRITIDVETIGSRSSAVAEALREELRAEEPPGSIRSGTRDARALERAGMADHYAGMAKGKVEWLQKNWNEPAILEARLAEALADTSVDPLLAEPIAIAWAVNDHEVRELDSELTDEDSLLRAIAELWNEYVPAGSLWVGHNHESFDLPLLISAWRRWDITPPASFPAWRHGRIRGFTFDTMRECATSRPFIRAQRAALAHGLGDRFKTTMWGDRVMDGSLVGEAHTQGLWPLIREYCRADVEATRVLADRMSYKWTRIGDREPPAPPAPLDAEAFQLALDEPDPVNRLATLIRLMAERGIITAPVAAALRA